MSKINIVAILIDCFRKQTAGLGKRLFSLEYRGMGLFAVIGYVTFALFLISQSIDGWETGSLRAIGIIFTGCGLGVGFLISNLTEYSLKESVGQDVATFLRWRVIQPLCWAEGAFILIGLGTVLFGKEIAQLLY